MSGAPTGRCLCGRPAYTNCPLCVTLVGPTITTAGEAGRPYHRLDAVGGFVSKVWASRRGGRTRCPNIGEARAGDWNTTTRRPERGAAVLPALGASSLVGGCRASAPPSGSASRGCGPPPYSPCRGRRRGAVCGSLGSCGSDCPSLCCLTASQSPRLTACRPKGPCQLSESRSQACTSVPPFRARLWRGGGAS